MSHTFDVRFARSQGLIALLEAPANAFLWKGPGKLSIDEAGVSIAVKRGLSSLFSRRRSHRIAAIELTEVYREGEALRLEFGTHAGRQVLPLWANGSETAAQIVKLLPTTHTIELEHTTQPQRKFHLHKRMLILLFVLLACAAVLLALAQRPSPAAVESSRSPVGTAASTPATTPVAQPIAADTVPDDVGRRQQDLFESELKELRNEYFSMLGREDAQALERLDPRWWSVRFRIEPSEPMTGPAFTGYREGQLAVVGSWNTAVSLYAAGLRMRDARLIELAEKQRELAEQQEHILRQYVR